MAYNNNQIQGLLDTFNTGLTDQNATQRLTDLNNTLGMNGVTTSQANNYFGGETADQWRNQMQTDYGYNWRPLGEAGTDYTQGYGGDTNTRQGFSDYGNWLSGREQWQGGPQQANQDIYNTAQQNNMSYGMVDQAMGYNPGQSQSYAQEQGWDALSGTDLTNAYNNPRTDYMINPATNDEIQDMNQFYFDRANWNGNLTDDYANNYRDYFDRAGITAAQANQVLGKDPGWVQNYINEMGGNQLTGVPSNHTDINHGYTQESLAALTQELADAGLTPEQQQRAMYDVLSNAGITASEMDSIMGQDYGTTNQYVQDLGLGLLSGRGNAGWTEEAWRNQYLPQQQGGSTSFSGGPQQQGTTGTTTGATNTQSTTQNSNDPGSIGPGGTEFNPVTPQVSGASTYTPSGLTENLDPALDNNIRIAHDAGVYGAGLQNLDTERVMDAVYNQSSVDQAQLYSDRLNDIIGEGSPLMDRAQTYANQQMAQRGLLNSSIGVGAAQAALLDQAGKIAAGDVDVDKFNVGESNTTGRALMSETGNTGRTGMNNNAGLYADSINAGYDMQSDALRHGYDINSDNNRHDNTVDLSNIEHGQNLETQGFDHAQEVGMSNLEHGQDLETMGFEHGQEVGMSNLEHQQDVAMSELEHQQEIGMSEMEHKQTVAEAQQQIDADFSILELEFEQDTFMEGLQQQGGLFAEFIDGYSQIQSSPIPHEQKLVQLRLLYNNIMNAVNITREYSGLPAMEQSSYDDVISPETPDGTVVTPEYTPLELSAQGLDTDINRIYEQVRVPGGDSEQEALIERWWQARDFLRNNNSIAYEGMMSIYNDNGITNDNWEDVLQQMTEYAQPYEQQAAQQAAAANVVDDTIVSH